MIWKMVWKADDLMEYTIRPIEVTDGAAIAVLRRMPGVMETTLGLPSVRAPGPTEFAQRLSDPNLHQFVAVLPDGTVIGAAALMVEPGARMRHSGMLAVLVGTPWQNAGVGRALMEQCINVADNYLMLVRLELCAIAGNERAIHLYESLGFIREGIKRCSVIQNGRYADEVLMGRVRLP